MVIFNENITHFTEQYVKKGSRVYVEGQLQTRKWQDQSGQDRYSTEVVIGMFNSSLQLIESRKSGGEDERSDVERQADQRQASKPTGRRDMDDEIPF